MGFLFFFFFSYKRTVSYLVYQDGCKVAQLSLRTKVCSRCQRRGAGVGGECLPKRNWRATRSLRQAHALPVRRGGTVGAKKPSLLEEIQNQGTAWCAVCYEHQECKSASEAEIPAPKIPEVMKGSHFQHLPNHHFFRPRLRSLPRPQTSQGTFACLE